MPTPDPITPLTPAEQALVDQLNASGNRETILAELKANLQTAVEIELATIPIYLYTYYSLTRDAVSGENMSPAQIYANKAGGVIMSVAVEEMLHMSLSANVLFALGVSPVLYGRAPAAYPTGLPYHNPTGPAGPDGATAVQIPLSRFSFEQLWHFLQIEYPEKADAPPQDRNWNTIGQFYSYIRCLISTDFITDADFQQGAVANAIQPDNYSPNNVDTVYPSGNFDPWKPAPPEPTPTWAATDPNPSAAQAAVYPNAADSHAGASQLVAVKSKLDALAAIDTISDQGEGNPVPQGEAPTDDLSKSEVSHYYKFLTLQAQLDGYQGTMETLPTSPTPPAPITPTMDDTSLAKFITAFPDNPTTAAYPLIYQPIVQFCSGLFQYMLIMTETVYKVPPDSQKLFFNEGLHRSMIWVMDKYIKTIRQIPIHEGPYANQYMAPAFENVDLGARKDAFTALRAAGIMAATAADALIAILTLKNPKDPVIGVLQNVIWYIAVAVPLPPLLAPKDGPTKHLPDVSPYWQDTAPDTSAVGGKADAGTASPSTSVAPGQPVPSPYPYAGVPAFPTTIGMGPTGMPAHACMGLNSCRGADRFGTAGPDGKGPNACAGQGYCSTATDHTCHVQNDCKGQGGCGLYGTGEEMNHPGANACQSLGSCATPINAERFSTNGPNQGKSVWLRAREVFQTEVWPNLRAELLEQRTMGDIPADQPLPETLGPVPAPFATTGPTYLWISDDNKDRSNMTACGSSGMSGAGGCS